MRKVFHFDSSPDHYTADATVLCCFDERIRNTVQKFLKKQDILRPDMIIVAGGAKTLASPRTEFERDFILDQIQLSIKLHQTKRVFLMTHSDCGAYGALALFKGDRERESAHHKTELQRAAKLIKEKFPDVAVQCFFVTFEGVFAACGEQAGDAA